MGMIVAGAAADISGFIVLPFVSLDAIHIGLLFSCAVSREL
jgi:hypothetical protein